MTQDVTIKLGRVAITAPADDAVRALLAQILSGAAAAPARVPGRAVNIGEYCAEHGGLYCGRLVDDTDRVYALIVARRADGELGKVTWRDAGERIGRFDINDFSDWSLPNRAEALAMFQRLHPVVKGGDEAFAEDVYWTSETYAPNGGYAWYQYFNYGLQNDINKDFSFRARAVRRVVI